MTGTGTAGSGGTIRHKTGGDGSTTSGIGIYLNATMSPSLSRMQLDDFDNFAIRGTGVNGFSLANSTVDGANGTSTGADEGSVIFDGLTGTTSITSNTIKGSIEDNVSVPELQRQPGLHGDPQHDPGHEHGLGQRQPHPRGSRNGHRDSSRPEQHSRRTRPTPPRAVPDLASPIPAPPARAVRSRRCRSRTLGCSTAHQRGGGRPWLNRSCRKSACSVQLRAKGLAQCNGQLLPINQNQALFSSLGTTYGGDGRVNFALPDLRSRVPIHMGAGHTLGERGGEQAHTLSIAEIPTHTHTAQASSANGNQAFANGAVLAGAQKSLRRGEQPDDAEPDQRDEHRG